MGDTLQNYNITKKTKHVIYLVWKNTKSRKSKQKIALKRKEKQQVCLHNYNMYLKKQ